MNEIILTTDGGAVFRRGDLHVHSFGASEDVSDTEMTPAAIVSCARERGVSILAITDHNSIDNVRDFLRAAAPFHDLLAVPGVELSCPEGHLLCYLPTYDSLVQVWGRISIVTSRGNERSRCNTGMYDVLEHVKSQGGFAVLAHVDVETGFEQRLPGMTPQKQDILCHSHLLAFEVRKWPSQVTYATGDADPQRAGITASRAERLGRRGMPAFACIVNSDAHDLAHVGSNANGRERTTRYKLNTLTFDALKIALLDPEPRVRVEEPLPQAVPQILGLALRGGFLGDVALRMSPNLTCIIGGRGTGKTMLMKCLELVDRIGAVMDRDHDFDVLESSVGPDELEVLVSDEQGTQSSVERSRGGSPSCTQVGGGATHVSIPIHVFHQSEASDLAVRMRREKGALLSYLDQHIVGVDELHRNDRDLIDELAKAQERTGKWLRALDQARRDVQVSSNARDQMAAVQKEDVSSLAALEALRSGLERNRGRLEDLKLALVESVRGFSFERIVLEYGELLANDVGGPDGAIVVPAQRLSEAISAIEAGARAHVASLISPLQQQLDAWIADLREAERGARERIETRKTELTAKKIPFDAAALRRLATSAAKYDEAKRKLNVAEKSYNESRRAERALEKKRRSLHSQLCTLRTAWSEQVMRGLTDSDLKISIKFIPDHYAPDALDIIVGTMGWRTNQVPRASAVLTALGYWGIIDAVTNSNVAAFQAIKSEDGAALFSKADAEELVARLSAEDVRRKLLLARVDCLARIVVSRIGSRRVVPFDRLSIGQQQSVLLALLLADDGTRAPLLLDQPEDNLDGEFVFKTIVPALRRAKERRQIIVVTHNPNICVLGDSEQIFVLKAGSDLSRVIAHGAIDGAELRARACEVLEGTEDAFRLRGQLYGVIK